MMEEASHSPRRVVSLQPSATAILAEIGELDKLVACTKYCLDICPQLKETQCLIVEDSWAARSEQILAARPDLVIASVPYQEESVGEILKAGVRFLGFAPRSLADIYGDIACIAGIMDAARRGELVIEHMKDEIGVIQSKAAGSARPLVYCEEWGKPLIASQLWVAELIEAAGGEFLGKPAAHPTAEAVLDANPDIVIASWCGAGDRVPLEKIVSSRGWKTMNAVENSNVFCIRDEFLNTPAPTLLHGLRALAAAIHPETFSAPAGLRRIATPVRT
jgi:iron complex transport system substrate-binding protein